MPRIVFLFAILLIYLFAPFLIVVDARLIGYWAFEKEDELGKDLSPLRNHGEPSGAVGIAQWTRQGKVGGGLLLADGQESWLEVSHNDSLKLKDQATLMC